MNTNIQTNLQIDGNEAIQYKYNNNYIVSL